MTENPFRVGGHVTGAHFTDRADEVHRIRRALVEPSRLLVYGPRRMGKSSTIAKAVDRVRADGGIVAWADFSTATTLTDISNRLLRSLSVELRGLQERIVDIARSVRPQLTVRFDDVSQMPVLMLGAEVRRQAAEDQRSAFESVLDRIEEFAAEHDEPVALVFDEFQDVLELGGERADWFLRGVMQRHQHVSYVCAGSKESLIHEMLGKRRAFYKHFELLHVDPIDAGHLARWIEDRMSSAGVDARGVGLAILEWAGGRTQDRLQLAREVHTVALPRGRAVRADVERAFDGLVRAEAAVFQALWHGLSATQQNALRALASDPDRLFAGEVLRRFGLSSTAAMARAIEALQGRGLVVRSAEGVIFDSPFFRGWVEREALPDIPSV